MLIYKILLPDEWARFAAAGRFDGSAFDRDSGFIHCSSREQVGATAVRFFPHNAALVVLALDPAALGDHVRWEMAADGGPYPHVYASVPMAAVVAVHRVAGAADVETALPHGR